MAGNMIVNNSQFRPFSYAEMIQPIQRAEQTHANLLEAYSSLEDKASILGTVFNKGKDPALKAQYDKYKEQLQKNIDILATEGISNPDIGYNLLQSKRAYTNEIVPIQAAANRLNMLSQLQSKARLNDGTLLVKQRAEDLSLQDLMDNPNYSIDSYSGRELQNNVRSAYSALTKAIKMPSVTRTGNYDAIITKSGLTNEEIAAFKENPTSNKSLNTIAKGALKAAGIDEYWKDYDKANSIVLNEAGYAVGQSNVNMQQNLQAVGDNQIRVHRVNAAIDYEYANKKNKQPELDVFAPYNITSNFAKGKDNAKWKEKHKEVEKAHETFQYENGSIQKFILKRKGETYRNRKGELLLNPRNIDTFTGLSVDDDKIQLAKKYGAFDKKTGAINLSKLSVAIGDISRDLSSGRVGTEGRLNENSELNYNVNPDVATKYIPSMLGHNISIVKQVNNDGTYKVHSAEEDEQVKILKGIKDNGIGTITANMNGELTFNVTYNPTKSDGTPTKNLEYYKVLIPTVNSDKNTELIRSFNNLSGYEELMKYCEKTHDLIGYNKALQDTKKELSTIGRIINNLTTGAMKATNDQ